MRRGEVWRVRLPAASGHAQAGERPALVIQHDAYTVVLPTVLVVPFTGSLAALRFAGTLRVDPDGSNGLTLPRWLWRSKSARSIGKTACSTLARRTRQRLLPFEIGRGSGRLRGGSLLSSIHP